MFFYTLFGFYVKLKKKLVLFFVVVSVVVAAAVFRKAIHTHFWENTENSHYPSK